MINPSPWHIEPQPDLSHDQSFSLTYWSSTWLKPWSILFLDKFLLEINSCITLLAKFSSMDHNFLDMFFLNQPSISGLKSVLLNPPYPHWILIIKPVFLLLRIYSVTNELKRPLGFICLNLNPMFMNYSPKLGIL